MNPSLKSRARLKQVENVVIFIADSVRFDKVPEPIINRGVWGKAISPSSFTAPSIPSILTGYSPTSHGVWRFKEQLSEQPDIVSDSDGFGYNMDNMWIHIEDLMKKPPYRILHIARDDRRSKLKDLNPPFTYVVHDRGGHTPYGSNYREWKSTGTFFKEHKNDRSSITELYQDSLEATADRFNTLLDNLADRSLLEDTLVVFTSDHGEILGEERYGGIYEHHAPLVPELIEVPMVFAGAGLPEGERYKFLLSGLDVVPTVKGSRGIEAPDPLPGRDLWNEEPLVSTDRIIRSDVCHGGQTAKYSATSRWTEDGGAVVHRSSFINRLAYLWVQHLSDRSVQRTLTPMRFAHLARLYLKDIHTYGSPEFDLQAINDTLPDSFNRSDVSEIEPTDDGVPAPTKEQLEKLGYLE